MDFPYGNSRLHAAKSTSQKDLNCFLLCSQSLFSGEETQWEMGFWKASPHL